MVSPFAFQKNHNNHKPRMQMASIIKSLAINHSINFDPFYIFIMMILIYFDHR